jgi:hypothetical protein
MQNKLLNVFFYGIQGCEDHNSPLLNKFFVPFGITASGWLGKLGMGKITPGDFL